MFESITTVLLLPYIHIYMHIYICFLLTKNPLKFYNKIRNTVNTFHSILLAKMFCICYLLTNKKYSKHIPFHSILRSPYLVRFIYIRPGSDPKVKAILALLIYCTVHNDTLCYCFIYDDMNKNTQKKNTK